MGLDISAYSKLSPAPPSHLYEEDDGLEVVSGHWDDTTALYRNEHFPDHCAGLLEGTFFIYEDAVSFKAGSYGGYSQWREWLAELVGYEPTAVSEGYRAGIVSRTQACFEGATGPFSELIGFSDCEGTIGPIVSEKLAKDFAEWDERAKAAVGETYNYKKYKEWREAFELAQHGGAVAFH